MNSDELIIINNKIALQIEEKAKLVAEIEAINLKLAFQYCEKDEREAELTIANIELAFQNGEKENRAAELIVANKELAFQNQQKEERAAELIVANKELAFQNQQKEERAAELIVANKELAFQNQQKEERAAELIVANKELAFQNQQKEERAAELTIANIELAFQNEEKEKRAAELIVANKELAFQNQQKEERAAELIVANKELAFQNQQKEERAAELIVANKELAFQNQQKEERAAELLVANVELAFQNEEKEKRAAQLVIANNELKQFAYIASHDLQEPLRTISNYIEAFELEHLHLLGEDGKQYISSINRATRRMSSLVEALLNFSRLGRNKKTTFIDCNKIVGGILEDLGALIKISKADIVVSKLPSVNAREIEIRQLFQNLITNAIKFVKKGIQPKIQICAVQWDDKWKFSVSDNGIGIDPIHFERVFDLFQRLHSNEKYVGNGIGLANCKKIVQSHQGEIWIESTVGQGTTFNFTIPS